MPTILIINGFVFFFWSNEHDPIHIHVRKGGANAKLNLVPNVELVYSYGFSVKEQKRILNYSRENVELFINEWKLRFGNDE